MVQKTQKSKPGTKTAQPFIREHSLVITSSVGYDDVELRDGSEGGLSLQQGLRESWNNLKSTARCAIASVACLPSERGTYTAHSAH
eukprot:SAG11_NODE_17695_length_511_cov_1.007282_1_plen_85_part_10